MYYYSLTVRKTTNPIWIQDYYDYIEKYLVSENREVVYHFEAKHGLHFHAMIKSSKKIYIDKIFPPEKGWNLDFALTKNREAWNWYIRKDRCHEKLLINKELKLMREYHNFLNQSEELIEDIPRLFTNSDFDGDPKIWKTLNLFTGIEIPK